MSIEAMKQVLEKIANVNAMDYEYQRWAREALAISEAEKQEPVAWQWLTTAHFRKKLPKDAEKGAWNPLYTTPQQRKPLTDEQIKKSSLEAGMQEHYMDFHSGFIRFARAIETAHGIKG